MERISDFRGSKLGEKVRLSDFASISGCADKGDPDAQIWLGKYFASKKKYYGRAAKWFEKAAEQGIPEAQFQLGAMFAATKLTPEGLRRATDEEIFGAKPDLPKVQSNVRTMIERGATEKEIDEYLALEGVTQRQLVQFGRKKILEPARKKAVKWYRKAAEQGHAEAQHNLARMYSRGEGVEKDYAEASRWYLKAAEQGLLYAQSALANNYAKGRGLPQDYGKAIRWYERAAEQAPPWWQEELGRMFRDGKELPQNFQLALKWFRRAAEKGDVQAQFYLAEMYAKGLGVPQPHKVVAHMWFNLAAARYPSLRVAGKAREARDELAKSMSQKEIAEAQKMAREWKPKSE